jgi:hypothetical protein
MHAIKKFCKPLSCRLATLALVIFFGWSSLASGADKNTLNSVDIYEYSVGITYPGSELQLLSPHAQLEDGKVKVEPVAFDSTGCFMMSPPFVATGEGSVGIALKLKRTFIGPVALGIDLTEVPYVNFEFHYTTADCIQHLAVTSITLGFIEHPINENIISKSPPIEFIAAYDQQMETYTKIFEGIPSFVTGSVGVCDVFKDSGIEVESIKVYLIH